MFKHYRSYFWKMGKPYGREAVNPEEASASYKIVVDPYYKRFSVEKYQFVHFDKVIYDSCLLDFRHLTLKDQIAWQRETLSEEADQTVCLLRNQDDRAILIETLMFDQNLCRACKMSSIHGVQLSTHRMFYRSSQDPFDGVVLYDLEERPVMMKLYEIDEQTGEFTNLISEEWNMETVPETLKFGIARLY